MNQNLKFFNKKGEYCNFEYDSTNDKWIGRIDFHTISVDLIENYQIYIMEELYDNTLGKRVFALPFVDTSWSSKFPYPNNPIVPEIFEYTLDSTTLSKIYSLTIDDTSSSYPGYYVDSEGYKNVQSTNGMIGAIQLNIGFQPSSENAFQSVLTISNDSGNIIAEITFYGEGEEEDERFSSILQSLGHDIPNSDSIIFADSDITEDNPDYTLINRKRKELLLEHSNIFPYIGSYKALINILKFYGYQNVHMREYWKNVEVNSPNFGKFRQTDIIDIFSNTPNPALSSLIPSKIYKKTNLFGLFYDINVENGEFDADGTPITEETFTFTPEEVLIKLYALKKKLMQYYLPVNAKIVDIVGEAIYFANYKINSITSQNRIDSVSLGIKPKYEVYPGNTGLIQDLRPIQFLGAPIGPDLTLSGYTNYLVYRLYVNSGINVNTGYVYGSIAIGSTNAGRVYWTRDVSHGSLIYTQTEVINSIVDSFNNPTYVSGFNTQEGIDWISSNFYAYAEPDNLGWIRIVQKNPLPGATAYFNISSGGGASLYPGSTSSYAINPSPGGSFGATGAPLSFYSSAYLGFFEKTSIPVNKLNDAPNIPVGYPVILKNKSFDITWENATVSYNQIDSVGTTFSTLYSNFNNSFNITGWTAGSTPITIGVTGFPVDYPHQGTFTWDNLGYYGHTEMQWIITKIEDDYPAYSFDSGQLPISAINDLPVNLPYPGKYTVSLRLWDCYNTQSLIIDEDVIEVQMPEPDFIGWYTKRELNYTWETRKYPVQSDRIEEYTDIRKPAKELTWDDYTSTWDLPLHPNEAIEMAEITNNSLDSIEFYQSMINPIDNPLVDRYAYQNNLLGDEAIWDDAYHLWSDNTGTKICEFTLKPGASSISISGSTGYGPVFLTISRANSIADVENYGVSHQLVIGPTGWTGPTGITGGTGATGDWVFVSSTRGAYQFDGTYWRSRTNEGNDSFEIVKFNQSLQSKDYFKNLCEYLNNLGEDSIFSDFIYYYNEEYDSSYYLIPYIKAVTKDFSKHARYKIKAIGVTGQQYIKINDSSTTPSTSHSYETVYFGYLGDIPTHFEINSISPTGPTGSFTITYLSGAVKGTTSYTYTIGSTSLSDLCNELNGSTAQALPIIGDFTYNVVYGASGWTGSGSYTTTEVKLQAVSKAFVEPQTIGVTYSGMILGTPYGRSLIKNPTWDNLRILKYSQELPLLTTVNFTYDNSKIAGKTKSTWILRKEDDENFEDIYYNNQYFSYMFNQRGSYTLSLILEDSNGNQKTVTKTEIIKII